MTDVITATPEEIDALDAAERILIGYWSDLMDRSPQVATPVFVESLIVGAVAYEPRLALTFQACARPGCEILVDDRSADEAGRVHCSDEHRDADAEDRFEEWDQARARERGRRTLPDPGPPSIRLHPLGVDPWAQS